MLNRSGKTYMNDEVRYDVVLKDSQKIGLFAKISQAANRDCNTQVRPNHLRSVTVIKHNSIGVEVLNSSGFIKKKISSLSTNAEQI